MVGALRVTASKTRVIAADFPLRPLRVIQEVEVMNRHDPCGAPGGYQQRVHRMRDIDRAGEGFNRRPLESMPRVVEQPHRGPRVDDACARDTS